MEKELETQWAAAITAPFVETCVKKPIQHPKTGEAMVKVNLVGICGSDLGRVAQCLPKNKGMTTGHEFVGTVDQFGPDTDGGDIHLHDRVAVVPLLPCFSCDFCQKGEYAHCPHYSFLGSRQDGGLEQYVNVPVRNLFPVEDYLDDEGATFIEPTTVALHAILKFSTLVNTTAVIIGAGTIGLLALQAFKHLGVEQVAMVDVVQSKLDLAKSLGADFVCNSLHEGEFRSLQDILHNSMRTAVVESSGSTVGKANAILLSQPLGEIVYIGGLSAPWVVDDAQYQMVLRKELVLKGCWMNYSAPFPGVEWILARNWLTRGFIDYKHLITHRFGLRDVDKAFAVLFDKKSDAIKVLVDVTQIP